MNIRNYFDLGLMPEEAVLGAKTKAEKRKKDLKRFFATLLMYVFVWLGILGQRVMALNQAGEAINWQNLGEGYWLVALVIATAVFPAVCPKVFVKMSPRAQKAGGGGWFFVQLFLAFQQGFFWEALFSVIVPK